MDRKVVGMSSYLFIHPFFYLSIHLSVYLLICLFISFSIYPSIYPSSCLSTYLSVYLPIHLSVFPSICETSSMFEVGNIKNEAILRDLLQTWKVECRADCLVPMRFAIFPLHLCKVLRMPRKSDDRSYEVLHLSRKIIWDHVRKPEDLTLQNATPLKKSVPWPPNISDEHVSCTAPATRNAFFQILLKCPTPAIVFGNPSRFAHFWRGAESLTFSTSQREVSFTFSLANVLRATRACNFSSLIWPHGWAPAALGSLHFDPPEPHLIGKTQWIATFLPFCAAASSFFWFFRFSSLLFSSLVFSSLLFSSLLLSSLLFFSLLVSSLLFSSLPLLFSSLLFSSLLFSSLLFSSLLFSSLLFSSLLFSSLLFSSLLFSSLLFSSLLFSSLLFSSLLFSSLLFSSLLFSSLLFSSLLFSSLLFSSLLFSSLLFSSLLFSSLLFSSLLFSSLLFSLPTFAFPSVHIVGSSRKLTSKLPSRIICIYMILYIYIYYMSCG